MGVSMSGNREILGLSVGDSEDKVFWVEFLQGLRARGLSGVELVISDAHLGLKGAISEVLVGSSWQRCRVHLHRGMSWPKSLALRPKSWQPSSEPSSPKSMTPQCGTSSMRSRISCVQTSRPCRTCSMRPKRISAPSPRSLVSTGRKPKSNNPLERVNAEIKRRTRVVGIFPNDASVLRLITAVCIEQHDEWTASERRYLSEGSMALLTVKDTAAALIGKQQALVARSRKC